MELSEHKSIILFTLGSFLLIALIYAVNVNAEDIGAYNDKSANELNATAPSAGNANVKNISELPDQGMVEISGTVEDLGDNDFTLKDNTGEIEVSLKEGYGNEGALPNEGDQVKVTGQVDDGGVFGRKGIVANKITVFASAVPTAGRF